ncbi:DUF6392 family protein [Salinicola avicenniae]|uniref:DUF6392 family protein n=1 Tax=Salinicola avicenniae TaxID=2916836 RepID=UPI0020739D41|nr:MULTISPECIES: DUF6392 family protein [unclassified Salinicola]
MTANLDELAQRLGNTFDELVRQDLLPETPRPAPDYDGADRLFLEPETGLVLQFNLDDVLQRIEITLRDEDPEETYQGQLFPSMQGEITRQAVRQQYGEPLETSPPVKLPIIGMTGGSDLFQADRRVYGDALMRVAYDKEGIADGVMFEPPTSS